MNDELNSPWWTAPSYRSAVTATGKDRLEMRRLFDGGFQLRHREVTDAEHADVAVAPRLRRHPLDQVVHVTAFLRIEETERPSGASGAAQVGDHMHVAAGHPEVGGSGLDESGRSAEVLYLAGIRRRGEQRGEAAVGIRAMQVGHQGGAVPHCDRDGVVPSGVIVRFAEVAIVPAGGLRAVQSSHQSPPWPDS
jgi:hypothetical protein